MGAARVNFGFFVQKQICFTTRRENTARWLKNKVPRYN
jgi:hypothetical protein